MSAPIAPRKALTQTSVSRMCREMPRGARIKFARTYASKTLDGLAAEVGTSRQHLIRLEQGKHNPTPALAARIAEKTGVPVELIRDEEDDEESDPVAALHRALLRVIDHRLAVKV